MVRNRGETLKAGCCTPISSAQVILEPDRQSKHPSKSPSYPIFKGESDKLGQDEAVCHRPPATSATREEGTVNQPFKACLGADSAKAGCDQQLLAVVDSKRQPQKLIKIEPLQNGW